METPDANETSIALENYRRVKCDVIFSPYFTDASGRLAIMVEAQSFFLLREGKCRKESILIITMDGLSSCLGKHAICLFLTSG